MTGMVLRMRKIMIRLLVVTFRTRIKNSFSFMKDKKLITLVPSTPKQVYEDEVRFKQEHDSKMNEKEKY